MTRYQLLRIAFTVLVRSLARVEVRGTENVPQDQPFILAVNHLTLLEPPVLFVVMPIKQITVFVARKWEDHVAVGWLIRSLEGIFVSRGAIDRQALRTAVNVLKAGGVIGMAPEGTRSLTGGLIRAKPGIAYLAGKADVPILPVGVSGQLGYKAAWKRFRRVRMQVNIGPMIVLPPVQGANRNQQLQQLADEVMVAIARLVDPELRGVYTEAVRPAYTEDEPWQFQFE